MRLKLNVNDLVDSVLQQVEREESAQQTKLAADNAAPAPEMTVPLAQKLVKFAQQLRKDAQTPVSFDDLNEFYAQIMEQHQ